MSEPNCAELVSLVRLFAKRHDGKEEGRAMRLAAERLEKAMKHADTFLSGDLRRILNGEQETR